ncbi:Parkin coregulated [Chlorella vulgaris]
MTHGASFDVPASERLDPTKYLRKREGSPGGLKLQPKREEGSSPRIAAAPGSPPAKPQRSSLFWRMYDRGDLPVRVEQARHNTIRWTVELSSVDLHYYLPIFVDGLLETQEPYRMLAQRGTQELVAGAGAERLLPVIPQLVMGLRAALRSPRDDTIQSALAVLRLLLASGPDAGLALVPYYRQLLPPLSRHISDNLNLGDRMDYAQASHRGTLGDLVLATLHALERGGGADAFHHIKYQVPLYESCLRPSRVARKA